MERMKDLEEMLRELSEKYKNSKSVEVYEEDLEWWFKIIDDLREENKKLKEENKEQYKTIESLYENVKYFDHRLCDIDSKLISKQEENKKLKEFKTKREESMFYFKALAERVEPINSKEAEELQKYKKLFERLYREELYYLEEENKKLNIKVASLEWEVKWLNSVIDKLKEENQTLELWLDRKEKLNEKYRKKIDELKFREDIADIVPEWEGHIAEETISDLQARIKELKERIDVLYEFIERNDKLVDEVIDEEDLDKLNRYIYIDDDLVDRTLESED